MSLAIDAVTDAPPCAEDDTWLACIACGETFAPFDDVRYTCDECDGLLEVRYADPPTFDDFGGGRRRTAPTAACGATVRGSRSTSGSRFPRAAPRSTAFPESRR
jgi:L-threonine synthase (EC 4.2.3.1)